MRIQSEAPGFDIWDVQKSLISEGVKYMLCLIKNGFDLDEKKKSVFCENMKCKFLLVIKRLDSFVLSHERMNWMEI